jgi:hypothetical protein
MTPLLLTLLALILTSALAFKPVTVRNSMKRLRYADEDFDTPIQQQVNYKAVKLPLINRMIDTSKNCAAISEISAGTSYNLYVIYLN